MVCTFYVYNHVGMTAYHFGGEKGRSRCELGERVLYDSNSCPNGENGMDIVER